MLGFNYHFLPRLFQCKQQQNNCCMLNMLYRWPSDTGDLSNKRQHLWPEVPERSGRGVRGPHGRQPAARARSTVFMERPAKSSGVSSVPFSSAFPPSLGTTRGGQWEEDAGVIPWVTVL